MKEPKRFFLSAEDLDNTPKAKRAVQETAPYDYRRDAALPYYERHPEHKPRPLPFRIRRRRLIREGR